MSTKYIVEMLLLLWLTVPAAPARAGGVVTVCDEAHLLAALAGGGTVTFTCSGTITLAATITIAADTTIDGSGQAVTISGNHGNYAVRVFTVNEGGTLNLNLVTVANGDAENGGGIYSDGGTVTVNNSTFSDNHAYYLGGGGIDSDGGTVTVNNSTFSGNSAVGWGGGISNYGGTLTVSNSTFSGNEAYFSAGGGIDNWRGTATISNSTFSGNHAASFYSSGGGIISYESELTVSNSTFSGNSAGSDGGGISKHGGTLTVSNSTFSGNSAGNGSGISNYGGTLTVSNSTFSGNRSNFGGGTIYNDSGADTIKNTIVANSQGGGNCTGIFIDGGGNLSYPDTTCPGINADPKLGPLRDNGGPTWTMALGPGSAAIDAGDDAICAADPVNNLDQRGVTRPQGPHCDIGAYERQLLFWWFPLASAQ